MKQITLLLTLLFFATCAMAQEPELHINSEQEYSDLARMSPEEYINLQLPPLHVLMENARNAPQVGYYASNREIEERELKTVRRTWLKYIKLNASYSYGSQDISYQNYIESNPGPINYSGKIQSWWNVGASLALPLDEIFNRRNKIKQQKKRIENTQYDMDRWYDELRLKIIDSYTQAIEKLTVLESAAQAMITAKAQYLVTEADFVNGKMDAQALSRQKSIENTAIREYEQVRSVLNKALLQLEVLTNTKILNKNDYQEK